MKYIQYTFENRIATITLNRPDKRNALNHDVVAELREAFSRAEHDESVKIIILKANGDVFCAGADLEYLQQLRQFSYEQNFADSSHLKELFYQIYTLKKIVIAQVQGHALAGGCGLATVCDFSFAAPEAKFGYTEVRIGFVPAIVMTFLIRKIGEAKARQLLLQGSLITAEEAQRLNLINGVIAASNLEETVVRFAAELADSNSGYAMNITKQMIARVQSLSLEEALTFASEMNAKARASDDFNRGISAFVDRKKISW